MTSDLHWKVILLAYIISCISHPFPVYYFFFVIMFHFYCPFLLPSLFPLLSTKFLDLFQHLVGSCSTLVALGLMRTGTVYGWSKPGWNYWQISCVHNYCLGLFFSLVFLMNRTCCARFISYLFEHLCSSTSII